MVDLNNIDEMVVKINENIHINALDEWHSKDTGEEQMNDRKEISHLMSKWKNYTICQNIVKKFKTLINA